MAEADLARRTASGGRLSAHLRAATRDAHEAAEDAADLRLACASEQALAGFLVRMAAGIGAVEAELAGPLGRIAAPPELLEGWRRAGALRADARRLDPVAAPPGALPPSGAAAFGPDTPPLDASRAAGAWYVLEGARLGGPVIARTAARELASSHGRLRSLAGPGGPAIAARWRTFAGWLDGSGADHDAAAAGARAAFAAVEAALRTPEAVAA